ncbi:MAG TPA: hypothetical protein VKB08_20805 [Bradyrhizobium sp.]|nr:hypothetical protein [Bradyrhizobium sp.]
MATALLIPALTFVSCKDDGNSNLIEPQANNPQSPAPRLAVPPIKIKASAAAVAKAEKFEGATLMAEAGVAPHDPTLPRMHVECLSGDEFGPYNGRAWNFRADHEHGCELNTFDGDAEPNNNAAIVATTIDRLGGRKVANTNQLFFYYAGGAPAGGSPRFSLFVDTNVDLNFDGHSDETVFIAADRCNDGDAFVGRVQPRAPNGQSDNTCLIDDDVHGTFANWADYLAFAAHANARYAATANGQPFIIVDQPAHYLVYRVQMKAGT